MLSRFVNKLLRKVSRTIASDVLASRRLDDRSIQSILWRRAAERSADFVERHLSEVLVFPDKASIRSYALQKATGEGLFLEFGVHVGKSVNFFADEIRKRFGERRIYGFDAFLGLSEDWFGHQRAARIGFDLGGRLPQVRDNVELVVGWIEETLPPFLARHKEEISFIHIDTDTYGPCKFVLDHVKDRLSDGALILFDEYLAYPNWEEHEHKALHDAFAGVNWRFLAFSHNQALIQVSRG